MNIAFGEALWIVRACQVAEIGLVTVAVVFMLLGLWQWLLRNKNINE